MTARLNRLKATFAPRGLDALLIVKSADITYLTGFPASDSWLLIASGRTYYITDARYHLEARQGLKGVTVRCYTNSIYEDLMAVVRLHGIRRLGIDERHLTLSQYKKIKRFTPKGVRLVKSDGLVDHLRSVKDRNEIIKIKQALSIHKQAQQFLKQIVKPNVTESEVLVKLECFVKSKGAGFSFPPIIASGPNSCYPHAHVTRRKLKNHEPVLIDMGIDVNGYKSDLTRMFFLGKIPELVQQVNDAVYQAQWLAIAAIRPGIMASQVDAQARNYLKKNKLDKYFSHALGHGVGLEVHETPRLAQTSTEVLRAGMVITVEPAVYIPGRFGVRIEDMVLVTPKGCSVLSDDID